MNMRSRLGAKRVMLVRAEEIAMVSAPPTNSRHRPMRPQCFAETGANCEVDYTGKTDWYQRYFKVGSVCPPGC